MPRRATSVLSILNLWIIRMKIGRIRLCAICAQSCWSSCAVVELFSVVSRIDIADNSS